MVWLDVCYTASTFSDKHNPVDSIVLQKVYREVGMHFCLLVGLADSMVLPHVWCNASLDINPCVNLEDSLGLQEVYSIRSIHIY